MWINAELYPYIANEIMSLCSECGYDSTQLKNFVITIITKENDIGLFSPTELAEFIIFGLNGDAESQKMLCKKAMRAAIKKL